MRYLYGPLVSSQQPAFQQGNDAIGQWQKVLTYESILADHIMDISVPNQAAVSRPVIGPNYAARHHHFWYCFLQTICRSICDSTKANTSNPVFILLGGKKHQNFARGTTTTLTRFTAANVGFVNFHRATEPIPTRADHGTTQLVQPYPRSAVTPKPQNTLKSQGANPMLLISNVPHRLEPKFQGFSGILENSPCSYGGLKVARGASIQTPVHGPKSFITAPWTAKTFGPS